REPLDLPSLPTTLFRSPGTAATGTFTITATEAAATVTSNSGLTLGEGTTATVTSSKLAASSDPGDPASELVYTLTTAPTHGTVRSEEHTSELQSRGHLV